MLGNSHISSATIELVSLKAWASHPLAGVTRMSNHHRPITRKKLRQLVNLSRPHIVDHARFWSKSV